MLLKSHVEFLYCNYYSDVFHCHFRMQRMKRNDEYHLMDHDDDMRNDSMKDDIHSNDDLGKFMEISIGNDRMDTSTI